MPMIPVPDSDRERWEEGARRLSMLEGRWREALMRAMGEFFAPQVRDRISSAVDISRAPYKHAVDQLNTLYLDQPTVSAGAADLAPLAGDTLWALRHEAHRVTIGLGECLLRWDVVGTPPRMTHRVVLPTCCTVITDPRDQHTILALTEVYEVPAPAGGCIILRETHDSREGQTPYRVDQWDDVTGWHDVTATQTRDLDDGVPYRDSAGVQIIPYSLHHFRLGSHTWAWHHWAELVAAQLHAGCLQTWLLAGIRDNAYPTRLTIDLDMPAGTIVPEGSVAGSSGGSAYVLLEPSTILRMRTSPTAPGGSGSVTTLQATMNVQETSLAAASYVEQALQDAGLGPADEAPAKGVSGHAIHISREALRRSQKQQLPAARLGDQRMLAMGARLANRYLSTSLPEEPTAYALSYHGIPLSTAEVQSTVDRVTRLLDAGLMTRAMALREVYPQMSATEAAALADELEPEEPAEVEPSTPAEDAVEDDAEETTDTGDTT